MISEEEFALIGVGCRIVAHDSFRPDGCEARVVAIEADGSLSLNFVTDHRLTTSGYYDRTCVLAIISLSPCPHCGGTGIARKT